MDDERSWDALNRLVSLLCINCDACTIANPLIMGKYKVWSPCILQASLPFCLKGNFNICLLLLWPLYVKSRFHPVKWVLFEYWFCYQNFHTCLLYHQFQLWKSQSLFSRHGQLVCQVWSKYTWKSTLCCWMSIVIVTLKFNRIYS